jgi:hypothetical protein
MDLLGLYLVGCALLLAAGVAKAVRPADTARAVVALLSGGSGLSREPGVGRRPHLRRWVSTVRLLAAGEAALGVLGLAFPHRATASAVAVSYLAFTCFVLVARATGGSLATCGCFGSPDTPPTVTHAVVTLALAVASVGVALAAPTGTVASVLGSQVAHGIPLVALSAVAAVLAWAVLSPLARLAALRAVSPG